MKVVSERSEREIAEGRAAKRVDGSLRALTANLIRCVRGAGKPHDLDHQVYRTSEALEDYRRIAGHSYPGHLAHACLSIRESLPTGLAERELRLSDAEDQMIRGALQVAASRLLSQRTQESAGTSEMLEGARQRSRIIDEMRPRGGGGPKPKRWGY